MPRRAGRAIRAGRSFRHCRRVESMTRAPFVMARRRKRFSRVGRIFDTTIGWRFINPLMEGAIRRRRHAGNRENVAGGFQVSRADQEAFAIRSQQRAGAAIAFGIFCRGNRTGVVPAARRPDTVNKDEHRAPKTTLEGLTKLKPIGAQSRHG